MNKNQKRIFLSILLGVYIASSIVIMYLAGRGMLNMVANAMNPCRSPSTNFTPFSKWISDDGKSVMYCLTNRYRGYGYTIKDGENELFLWEKNTSKGDANIDLHFYFPKTKKHSYMVESSKEENAITITKSKNELLDSYDFEWSSFLKKIDISKDEMDVRYAGKTDFINEALSLEFYTGSLTAYKDGVVSAHVSSNAIDFDLKLLFTDQYRFQMEEGNRMSNGTCLLDDKFLVLTFEKDEIYGHPGESFNFGFRDANCK